MSKAALKASLCLAVRHVNLVNVVAYFSSALFSSSRTGNNRYKVGLNQKKKNEELISAVYLKVLLLFHVFVF